MARIKRGAYELSWEKGGVEIRREGALLYYNRRPLYAFLKTAWGICEFYDAPYRFVRESGKAVEAGGELETPNGSCLSFLDRYEPVGEEWKISRRVVVERAGKDDRGFATKLSFVFAGSEQVRDYDCFAPATWYRDNRYARPYVIGFDPDCEYFWRKETALTLPLFAAQNRKTGETIRFSRWAADVTLPDEGLSRSNQFIDASYTVGALGLSKPENKTLNTLYYGFTLRKELPTVRDGLSIDYVYPGAEGQEWGRQQLFQIDYMMSTKTLSRSFHPVAQGFSDSYAVGLALSRSDGFYAMMRTAWRSVFARLHDTLLQVDQEKQYKACVAAMKKLTRDYGGGAWGVPFAAYLPAVDVDSVSLQFGFVGQQPGIAYQLMAYGAREGDAEACEKGRRVIQFWVDRAANGFGMPNGCYSPVIQSFEPYPIWLRMSADGLENILDAYVLTKKRGEDHADWLAFCRRAADWLVSAQNEDGSYYRAYNQDGSMRMDSKANTISIVRFLVQLYLVTKEEAYRQTALRAGEWSYHHVYEQMVSIFNDPNAEFIQRNPGWRGLYIPKSCSDPEAALRFCLWAWSDEGRHTLLWGEEGVDWNWSEDHTYPELNYNFENPNEEDGMKYWGWTCHNGYDNTAPQKSSAGSTLDAYTKLTSILRMDPIVGGLRVPPDSDESVIMNNLEDLEKNERVNIVTAATEEEALAAYDNMIAMAKEMGSDKLVEWAMPKWQERQAAYDEIKDSPN